MNQGPSPPRAPGFAREDYAIARTPASARVAAVNPGIWFIIVNQTAPPPPSFSLGHCQRPAAPKTMPHLLVLMLRMLSPSRFCPAFFRRPAAELLIAAALASLSARASAAPSSASSSPGPSAADYPSIQAALDQNPGRMVFVPAGDYPLTDTLHIRSDHSGLWGPGHLVQTNPEAGIVEIQHATDIQLRDLVLTRSAGKMETHRAGLFVNESHDIRLDNLQVIDNRGDLASIYARSTVGLRIQNCLIENYSRISIDDRRKRPDVPNFDIIGGYSFNTISGTGLGIRACGSVLIQHNRIIETVMIPTPELKQKYKLGSFAARDAEKGRGLSDEFWKTGYSNAWHQGSAIAMANLGTDPLVQTNPFVPREADPVPEPGTDNNFQVIGNYIENAAQGMDVHVDHALVAYNLVNNSFIGMKAVHGARNVIIVGNQFTHNDLWAILLMPGTTSHGAREADGDTAAQAPNIDGHSIVAHNIISDFGYGNAHWIWKDQDPTPIYFNANGALLTVPPERDVIVEGNLVYDTGRDQILVDGQPRVEPPRYHYAVKIATGQGAPQGLRFANNLLDPGTKGLSNIPLPGGEIPTAVKDFLTPAARPSSAPAVSGN